MINALQNTALGLVEIGSNQLLGLDEEVLEQCEKLAGYCVALEITDLEKTLYCQPGSWGINLSLEKPAKEVDAMISGRTMALVNLSLNKDKIATSIQQRVEISGNAQVAQQFQKILAKIDIDWEEQISKYTGDVLAVKITQTAKQTHQWLLNSLDSLLFSSKEYVQEEIHLMPTHPEYQRFKQDVKDTRDAVDRLQARIDFIITNQHV